MNPEDKNLEILVILQFLEGAKGKYCEKYKKNYKKCIENRNNRFEVCHLRDLESFFTCNKKII